jgi:hypothetical protein
MLLNAVAVYERTAKSSRDAPIRRRELQLEGLRQKKQQTATSRTVISTS